MEREGGNETGRHCYLNANLAEKIQSDKIPKWGGSRGDGLIGRVH